MSGHPASQPRPERPVTPERVDAVDHAITSRRSMRRFLPREVPHGTLHDILRVASFAPSGSNTQPWQVHVVTGPSLATLKQRLMAAFHDPSQDGPHGEEYAYYPTKWLPPFAERRKQCGKDLYGVLELARDDPAGMLAQQGRNFVFFDAPVALFFTLDRVMGQGSWLDVGMFMQNVMVAARARGLDTCPQAALNLFHGLVARHLGLDEGRELQLAAMSLGWADPDAIENTLYTGREPVEAFTRFHT